MSKQIGDDVVLARELVKKFGDFEAVKGVNFAVSRGECFGLLGPNGAGKTSIVKMIYGFSPVTSGKLEVFGEDIMASGRKIKSRVGVVPQEDNLDPELSVRENLIVYAGYFLMKKDLAKKRAEEILAFMDLADKSGEVVEHLSGGLKRRLTVGRALINQPELLILDEPTTGLDPYARHLVWQRLRKLKELGTTMLLTTHYLEEASQLCDRLIVIYLGEILEQGAPQDLIERHVGKEALEMGVDPLRREALIKGSEELIKARQELGDDLIIFTDYGRELAGRISERAAGMGILLNYRRLRQTNLEDVFLKLTGETLKQN
ncbi:MAG: putative ABC transporter ATP-binding protein YbhF [Pelotomaculum sp. PtaU1.Bin035]|nr:MAG: putative ABC transporter ATP-binding protein YbhF [Pelotomaculum sp. PtaU1.Bin035]